MEMENEDMKKQFKEEENNMRKKMKNLKEIIIKKIFKNWKINIINNKQN